MSLDPITLSVIQSGLQQVCDEMDLTFSRAAFSPVIAEANDRSDGIYSALDGSLIAQGATGLPVFVGTMQYSTRTLIEMIAAGKAAAPQVGDIYIVNDPYLGGTHLMDVRFAMPVYRDGKIFCWLSNTGHWPHTGGAVPGCRRCASSNRASWIRKFTPSSVPISAFPSNGSATSKPRLPPFSSVSNGFAGSSTAMVIMSSKRQLQN
jgi:N-methylhydantoinase B/oxoprolinase/acetone carboxylase alpha subunit